MGACRPIDLVKPDRSSVARPRGGDEQGSLAKAAVTNAWVLRTANPSLGGIVKPTVLVCRAPADVPHACWCAAGGTVSGMAANELYDPVFTQLGGHFDIRLRPVDALEFDAGRVIDNLGNVLGKFTYRWRGFRGTPCSHILQITRGSYVSPVQI